MKSLARVDAIQLEGYQVVAPLSSGGMASLYLAHRIGAAGFKKLVAIKVVHPHLARDPSFVRMFLDEALLCSRIDHPNVVHVEELGEQDGAYFLVMEFVHGIQLSQLLRGLAQKQMWLSTELAVSIAMSLADGLHAAHEVTDDHGVALGVVHRDVSPQNVLLDGRGFVKLIDFGIAKSRSRAEQTEGGVLKGKFRYMAPEQARGEAVDRRTDVFALGVVLWEMLAMRRLHAGRDDISLLLAAQEARISPPSRFNPSISAALDRVVLSALAKVPEQRPPTAEVFREELARALPSAGGAQTRQLGELVRGLFREVLDGQVRSLPDEVSQILRVQVPEGVGDQTRALTVASQDALSYLSEEVECDVEPSLPSVRASRRWPARIALACAGALIVAGASIVRAPGRAAPLPDRTVAEAPTAAVEVTAPASGSVDVTPSPVPDAIDAAHVTHRGRASEPNDRELAEPRRARPRPEVLAPASGSGPSEPVVERTAARGPRDVHGSPLIEDVPF